MTALFDFDLVTALATTAFWLVVLMVKFLLDFHAAPRLVWLLCKVPSRSIFRSRPVDVSGTWESNWSTESQGFSNPADRHDTGVISQFGPYFYTELYAKGVRYTVFGRVKEGYLVGDWCDKSDAFGYYGTFQLKVVNSSHLIGQYLGHSQSTGAVENGLWEWKRLK